MSRPRTLFPFARGWSLRRRTAAMFVSMTVLFAILLAAVSTSLYQLIVRGDDVISRWAPALSATEHILDDLVNQETGIRGYALTGNAEYLRLYRQYRGQERRDVTALRADLGDHADLRHELDVLETRADAWRARIVTPFVRAAAGPAPERPAQVAGPAAKSSFDAIRAAAATLTAHTQVYRRAAGAARRKAQHVTWAAIAITVCLIVIVGVLVWRGLRKAVLQPVDDLARQTRQVAAGNTQLRIVAAGPPEIAALGRDVDAMRARIVADLDRIEQARQDVIHRSHELARSNADLEQFAYVASHDLSEPLRKIANFCQLLERQYAGQLDDKARQYIGFAVDGAKRMQVLIADLLAFSRVGRTTEQFVPVDMAEALARAVANLDDRIAESGAQIVRGPMPTVLGDASLLAALLQNLLGNAIKYRRDEPPLVEVAAEHRLGGWLFTVSDNGIGIDPQYAERIFAIFQRLHLRDRYGGTGIGLALCRRIADFHGGRIWLAERPGGSGPGATFCFTLPDESTATQPRDVRTTQGPEETSEY